MKETALATYALSHLQSIVMKLCKSLKVLKVADFKDFHSLLVKSKHSWGNKRQNSSTYSMISRSNKSPEPT